MYACYFILHAVVVYAKICGSLDARKAVLIITKSLARNKCLATLHCRGAMCEMKFLGFFMFSTPAAPFKAKCGVYNSGKNLQMQDVYSIYVLNGF